MLRLSIFLGAIVFLLALAAGIAAGPPVLAGDSWEYCWVAYSVAEQGTPTIDIQQKPGFVHKYPGSFDSNTSPGLPLGSEKRFYDTPHFWMYSAMAAPFYVLCDATGHSFVYAFLFLHASLLGFTTAAAYALFGKRGAALFVVFFVGSPVLLYLSRPHTELFTFCWFTLALLFVSKNRLLAGAACLAMAATQNTPFIPFVFLLLGIWFLRNRWPYRPHALAALVAVGVIALLDPAFYLMRHGAINGHVAVGQGGIAFISLRKAISLFIDPDLGLFANWPLGIVIIAVLVILHPVFRKACRENTALTFSGVVFVLVMPFFQSMAVNWNSGGTVDISRYATWYLPVFFIALMLMADQAEFLRSGAYRGKYLVIPMLLAVPCIGFNVHKFSPSAGESAKRTAVAEAIYSRWPGLYDPVPEVFVERAVGREGDLSWSGNWAASNAGCNKIYVPGVLPERPDLPKPAGCERPVDGALLSRMISDKRFSKDANDYVNLPLDAVENLAPSYASGMKVDFSKLPSSIYLGHGWSIQEAFGRWSDGANSDIGFHVAPVPYKAAVFRITGGIFSSPEGSCRVDLTLNGADLGILDSRHQAGPETYEFPLRLPLDEFLHVRLHSQGMREPDRNDRRQLCFYVKSMEIAPAIERSGSLPIYDGMQFIDFSRAENSAYLAADWSIQEPAGHWSDGPTPTIAFDLRPSAPTAADYVLEISGAPFLWRGHTSAVRLFVNGDVIGNLDAGHKYAGDAYRFKLSRLKPGKVEIKFVVDNGNPAAADDKRRLGFYIRAMQLIPAAQAEPEYQIGTLIDFSDPSSRRFLGTGWSVQEPYGRWSDGRSADIHFRFKTAPERRGSPVMLTLTGGQFKEAGHDPRISLLYNKQVLGSFTEHMAGEATYKFPIPSLASGGQVLSLRVDNPRPPNAADQRQIGFYIRSLRISSK